MYISQAREQYVRWLLLARDLSPHTIRAYDGDVAAFERHVGIGALVAQIDRDRVLGFVEAERQGGLAPASMRRRACGLRGFLAWLVSRELLEEDPWVGVSVVASRSRKLPRTLSPHDLDLLLTFLRDKAGLLDARDWDEAPSRPHALTTLLAVALMVATGVRVHEVVGINCQDIDLSGRSVRLLGKGRRERYVYLTNDWITGLTTFYLAMRASVGPVHPQLLFNTHSGPLTTSAMRLRLAKAAEGAGLRTRVTPHMLRHTAATQLIEAGVDIRYIQRLLGHASLSTTEIYTHVSDAALKRVVSDADVLGRLAAVDN
jgi:site-specific recombinase XerD